MKKIVLSILLFVMAICCYSQTDACGYINLKYGSLHRISSMDHMNHVVGFQTGSFLSDEWGVEIDCEYGIETNNIHFYRLGLNALYQFIYVNTPVTPYVKAGIAHKTYKNDNEVLMQGCDVKVGGGINIPIYDNISLNMGINIANCINDVKNAWDNTMIEFEAGVCILIY